MAGGGYSRLSSETRGRRQLGSRLGPDRSAHITLFRRGSIESPKKGADVSFDEHDDATYKRFESRNWDGFAVPTCASLASGGRSISRCQVFKRGARCDPGDLNRHSLVQQVACVDSGAQQDSAGAKPLLAQTAVK